MQLLVEIVDSVTCSARRIVGMLVLCVLLVVGMITLGVSYSAPKVAEQIGERAESLGDKAIAAAREEHRAQLLAEEGWGTSEPTRLDRDSDWGTQSDSDWGASASE